MVLTKTLLLKHYLTNTAIKGEYFKVISNLAGYFHFARFIFRDPPKIPFKTSRKLTLLRLF